MVERIIYTQDTIETILKPESVLVQLQPRVTFKEFTATFQNTTRRKDRGERRPSTNWTWGSQPSRHAVCWYSLLTKESCRQKTACWSLSEEHLSPVTAHYAPPTMHMCDGTGQRRVPQTGMCGEERCTLGREPRNMMDSGRSGASCIELCRGEKEKSVGLLGICVNRFFFPRN